MYLNCRQYKLWFCITLITLSCLFVYYKSGAEYEVKHVYIAAAYLTTDLDR